MSGNPWLVENIQEFSFLNCPECAFKVKEEDKFQDHAVRNHSQSSALFGHNAKSEFINVKTEPSSEISSEHFQCVLPLNDDEITGFKITIDEHKIDPSDSILPKKEKTLDEVIEVIEASTSNIQKRKSPSDQSLNKSKRTKVQLESRKDLKCDFCSFSTFERSDLVLHVQKGHLSINSDDDENHIQSEFITVKREPSSEISSEPFKHELSSNVHDEIILHKEQKIDPLGGISPKTERTFEELIFLEPELPDPDNDKEPIIMKTYSFDEKNTYASLITEALNNFPNGAALHPDSIYKAINARYPQYKMDNPIWKADIRNNLSINKSFIQEDEYWKLASDVQPKQFRVQFKCTKCQFSTYEVEKLTEHTKNVHVQFNEKICGVHAEKPQMQIRINAQESYRKSLKKKKASVQNLDDKRKAQDIFKESIGKESENDVKPFRRSYASLITEALDNAPNGALPIADIYKAINARHPEYSLIRCSGWQNSIRHNLSLHKNFIREGKYWKLAYPDNSISTSKVQNSNKQDLDIGVKHNEIGENSLVDKEITNVTTENVRITPKILKIIPMEKFPQKDQTTSIFKCQIPPKKIPKPIIADEHNSHQEKMS